MPLNISKCSQRIVWPKPLTLQFSAIRRAGEGWNPAGATEAISLTHVKNLGIIGARMRTSLKRLLLVLVLGAAVPLQGFAAASIDLCRAFPHHQDAAAAGVHDHSIAIDASAHHEGHDPLDADTGQDSHHCAACASCGVAAAISAAPRILVTDVPHQAVIALSVPAPDGHVPDGLDRPPLALLA